METAVHAVSFNGSPRINPAAAAKAAIATKIVSNVEASPRPSDTVSVEKTLLRRRACPAHLLLVSLQA